MLLKRLNGWKDNVENRGMRVNINKTKVMINGKWEKVTQKAVRWPYGVCGRSVDNNSIQCTSCQKWYTGNVVVTINGSMYKVMETFVCRGCMHPVTSTGCTGVDISVNANLELVDKFCYLGDMLSVDGDADAAVEARIRIGWNKFRQIAPLLTDKDISLLVRRRFYSSCVQSSMLHRSETWPIRKENEVALQREEMRMVRWICGVDRVPNKGLRERLGLDDIISVLQQNRLQWYGHVLRKEDNNWVKNV